MQTSGVFNMKKTYHILNGDSLKNGFPKTIEGQIIVCRECLVDGNVQGGTLEALYKNRTSFLATYFPEQSFDTKDYDKVISEFEKIKDISENSEINFWFEEDLFCQVNFWFTIYLVHLTSKKYQLNLVLPLKGNKFSFNDRSPEDLFKAHQNKIEITEIAFETLSKFWNIFQQKNFELLTKQHLILGKEYEFMLPAIKAWKENRAKTSLKQVLKELKTDDFARIFNKFKEKEAIYGYGDLQVKRLLEELKKETEDKKRL